ncbi:MAG TPA: DUF1802 family protein [Methylomirabilota bacterium]|nr:DUF1802 family protein [Methylomirabilota bacterium]
MSRDIVPAMLAVNGVALKEWAVVCDRLAAGRQIVLLRKGGLGEPASGFSVAHGEFFLFPTYVHENEADLVDDARAALPAVARSAPPAGELTLTLYAVVERDVEVRDLAALRRLDGEHALTWPAVERRFHYRRPGLHAMAVRVYRLPRPLTVPNLPAYGGCRSWVPLESALPVTGARPVLEDPAFRRRLAALDQALAPTA